MKHTVASVYDELMTKFDILTSLLAAKRLVSLCIKISPPLKEGKGGEEIWSGKKKLKLKTRAGG